MSKPIYILCVGLLLAPAVHAQSFRFRAGVEPAKQSGYHRIALPPAVVGRLNAALTDIRLYNSQQRQVPYVLIRQPPWQRTRFVDYELVSKQSLPRVVTSLVIRNRSKSRIRELGLVIRNTNVGKTARLSGSTDARNWYALDDDLWISPTQSTTTTAEVKRLYFPLSDYEYYRLDIDDSLSAPLNILRVGHYIEEPSTSTYTALTDLSFIQRDSSNKRTYIHLSQPGDARFDKLVLVVQATSPFRRRAELGPFRSRKQKRRPTIYGFEPVRSFVLSDPDSNLVYLSGLKASNLYVVIDNEDNPPLVIRDVRAYQLNTYLLANLIADSPYKLQFSGNDMIAPVYDQTPFQASLRKSTPVLSVKDVRAIHTEQSTASSSFFTDGRVIWPVLGLILFMLGLLSYRMLREMGRVNP